MAARPTPEAAMGLPRLTDPTRVAVSDTRESTSHADVVATYGAMGVSGKQQPAHREFDDPRAQRRHDEEARLDVEHRRDIGCARDRLSEDQCISALLSLPADHSARREDDSDARLPSGRQIRPLKTHRPAPADLDLTKAA